MKRFTKVRRILALSLVLAMAFGGTVFASDSNTALVNATYQQLASRGTYTYTNASELSRFVQLGYACNQPQHQGPFSITQGTSGSIRADKDLFLWKAGKTICS